MRSSAHRGILNAGRRSTTTAAPDWSTVTAAALIRTQEGGNASDDEDDDGGGGRFKRRGAAAAATNAEPGRSRRFPNQPPGIGAATPGNAPEKRPSTLNTIGKSQPRIRFTKSGQQWRSARARVCRDVLDIASRPATSRPKRWGAKKSRTILCCSLCDDGESHSFHDEPVV